jgi:CRP-like cAMP-binding protein
MVASGASRAATGNMLLAGLPVDDFRDFDKHLESVPLVTRRVLYDPNQPISHVYFPESGMVSLLGVLSDGTGVETASTGREGMIGMPLFHGIDRFPEQAVVQLPGRALRMTAEAFGSCLSRSAFLRAALQRYAACIYMMAAQSSVCLGKHAMAKRLARWLLQAADQSGTEQLQLTHLFMAQMLSVRRSSVTVAAGELRQHGFIEYGRKRVTIVDRGGLTAYSCECYAMVRDTYARLLFGRDAPDPLAGVVTSRGGVTTVGAPHGEKKGRKKPT